MDEGGEELRQGSLVTPSLRLVERVGGGGMGAVWTADHLTLETRVAVKFIAHSLSTNAATVARFRREAAAAAQVKSPHVVQILDSGVTALGTPFIVMELLEGRDLRARIAASAPMPPGETVSIIKQVARALGKAHELGIVHRDIKPENVFLCHGDDGEAFVKVLDFGIAKSEGGPELTTTGTAVGTPYYMSPEQLIGSKTIDLRSDLWSVGVMTFYMLTGRRPYTGETAAAVAVAIHQGRAPKLTQLNASLPWGVDAWFSRACAQEPSARFASAKELAVALAEALGVRASAMDVGTGPRPYEPPRSNDSVGSDVTMPAPVRTADAATTVREAPRFEGSPPASDALSGSGLSKTNTASVSSTAPRTKVRSSRLAWGVAGAAMIALGVLAVQSMRRSEPRPTTSTAPISSGTVATPPVASTTSSTVAPAKSADPTAPTTPITALSTSAAKPTTIPPRATSSAAPRPTASAPSSAVAKPTGSPGTDELPDLK